MGAKEILHLIDKLQSKTISPEELKKLRSLLHTTDGSKTLLELMNEKFEETSTASDTLSRYENDQTIKASLIRRIQKSSPSTKKRNSMYYWSASLAAISLLIGFLFLFQKRASHIQELEWVTISTSHGERKKVTLNDSSIIQLNGNTKLSYPKHIASDIRVVKLDGEAFFDIVTDKKKPFLVISKEFTTHVVGTSFNIDTDIERSIAVHTGKVNIYATTGHSLLSNLSNSKNSAMHILGQMESQVLEKMTLEKGEKAKLTASKWSVIPFQQGYWYDNELIHLNEPLEEVAKKAYRFYGDSIYVGPELARTRISISFRNRNIEQVVNTLNELSKGKLVKDQKTEIWKILEK